MNIKFNIYKYSIIFYLFFFVLIAKTTAQKNNSYFTGSNLPLAGLAIMSSIGWEKDKLVPNLHRTLHIDTDNTKIKKPDTPSSDTLKSPSISYVLLADSLKFSSIVSDHSAILQWKSSNLSNARELIIEQSKDGTSFEEVSAILMDVEEKLNGIIIPQEDGLIFYRLKVLDKNGSTAYTESLACRVDTKASGIVSIYPNLISDEWLTALSIVTAYRGKIKVVITDDHGRQLIEFQREIISEKSEIPIGVATIPKGAYYIFVSMKDGSHIGSGLELIKS
jgi:hypothetical protein